MSSNTIHPAGIASVAKYAVIPTSERVKSGNVLEFPRTLYKSGNADALNVEPFALKNPFGFVTAVGNATIEPTGKPFFAASPTANSEANLFLSVPSVLCEMGKIPAVVSVAAWAVHLDSALSYAFLTAALVATVSALALLTSLDFLLFGM